MDLDLENHLKNDFLPLISGIKQEQLDSGASDVLPQNHLPSTAATTSTSSVGNPCDSAEKRVSSFNSRRFNVRETPAISH